MFNWLFGKKLKYNETDSKGDPEGGLYWRELIRWWIPASLPGTVHSQNRWDVLVNEGLRPRLGPLLSALFPGYGGCEHCHWPWPLVIYHTTMLSPGSGVFPVCEFCWRHFRGYGKDNRIRELYHQAREKYWPDTLACVIDAALDQEFASPNEIRFHKLHPDDMPD